MKIYLIYFQILIFINYLKILFMRVIKNVKSYVNNLKINFFVQNYRKHTKEYLQENFHFNNWELKTVVHIIPFLYGILNIIWSRYKDLSIPFLLEPNIPRTHYLREELSWEIFEYLKSKNITEENINKIKFYNNSCIIELKNLKQKKSGGLILSASPLTFSKIGINNYKLRNDDSLHFFWKSISNEHFFYELDQLPQKLEQNPTEFLNTQQNSIFWIRLNNFVENKTNSLISISPKIFDVKNDIIASKKLYIPKIFIQNFEKKSKHSRINYINAFHLNKADTFTKRNKKLTSRKNNIFLLKKNILKKELDSLFYIKGIFPNHIENLDYVRSKTAESQYVRIFLGKKRIRKEKFLRRINSFLSVKTKNRTFQKKVSGYLYPDLDEKTIFLMKFLASQRQSKSLCLLKINLPSDFFTLLKKKDLISSNSCSPLIFSNSKKNFLGTNLKQTEKLLINNLIITERHTTGSKRIANSDSDSELSLKRKKPKKIINFEQNNIYSLFSSKVKSKKLIHRNLFFTRVDPIKSLYHFVPFSQNTFNNKNPITVQIADLFKRTVTFSTLSNSNLSFLKKSNFQFYEFREPISLISWMIITQVSFGFYFIKTLKGFSREYDKEFKELLQNIVNLSGVNSGEIRDKLLAYDLGYRVIKRVKRNFNDIAGIDEIFLQVGEIVWFLRNSCRTSIFKNSISNSILLTGPPGTGKTLLVQAIAGEAEVPIILDSGTLLSDPQQSISAATGDEKLKAIFTKARELAPCIVFIDEVDAIGQKRENIIQTAMDSDDLIDSIYQNNLILSEDFTNTQNENFLPNPLTVDEKSESKKDIEYELFRTDFLNQKKPDKSKIQQNLNSKKRNLSILTQFLTEMDGLKDRQGVIIIGATNKPNVIDPALLRPGRFEKILNLELPGKQKRIEILKLYARKYKLKNKISWDYLAKRTRGFSAADLAAAMNESTIKSILAKSTQTIATIEQGIDLVTNYNFVNNISIINKKNQDPFFVSRLAYYQSGKAVLQFTMEHHPSIVVFHLWPRSKNARHSKFNQNSFSKMTNRLALEAQLIGFYAGKASEIIAISGNKRTHSFKRWHSNFDIEDLVSGTFLAFLLVDKWFFYSINVLIKKTTNILSNYNEKVFSELEKLHLLKIIEKEIEDEIEIEKISQLTKMEQYQQRGFGPWWQIQVARQTSEIESFLADWYRLYLPNPEETLLNLEWIPPDEYYHSNNSLKKLSNKNISSYKDLYKINRDFFFHSLIRSALNYGFYFLENKREFLDYFADHLLRFEILRENDIQIIFKKSKYKNKKMITSNLNKI